METDVSVWSASAPGRCGILGNPSDIYGGRVLACSAPVRARCQLRFSDELHLPEDTRLWDAAVARYPLPHPVDVDWQTAVPRSSGLSGSTALLAATLASVLQARGEAPDLQSPNGKVAYAELVRDIERNEAKIVCGYQDAYMIVHGGLQLMNFAGKHPIKAGPPATLRPLQAPLPFLLITTGVERLSGSVHGPMAQRWLDGDQEVREAILRITDLAEPGAEHLLDGRYDVLGQAMDENQRLTASLGGSGDAIDALISKCKSYGALGAKLAGAGLGGTVIALTEHIDSLEQSLRGDGYTRFLRPSIEPGCRIERPDSRYS